MVSRSHRRWQASAGSSSSSSVGSVLRHPTNRKCVRGRETVIKICCPPSEGGGFPTILQSSAQKQQQQQQGLYQILQNLSRETATTTRALQYASKAQHRKKRWLVFIQAQYKKKHAGARERTCCREVRRSEHVLLLGCFDLAPPIINGKYRVSTANEQTKASLTERPMQNPRILKYACIRAVGTQQLC